MATKNVDFIYAMPLDGELRRTFEERGEAYPVREEIAEVMQRWRTLWQETVTEHKILDVLEAKTKRVPNPNLECFIFGRGLTPKSTPFMMPIWNRNGKQWTDEKFVDLMIHELLHIYLVTDNDTYWKHVRQIYSSEAPVVQNHILLYALLEDIYKEIWDTEPLDFSRDNLPPGYARAVALVRTNGFETYLFEYYALQT